MSDDSRETVSFVTTGDTDRSRSEGLDNLRNYLESLRASRFPPSVSLTVVNRYEVILQAYTGVLNTLGPEIPTTAETRYDLASLTKVVCTTTLALMWCRRGSLDLDGRVVEYLPGYPQQATTLRHLLTHTSGLVDHRPFYLNLKGREEIEPAVYKEATDALPGREVCYSDLSFMLLGWVLEDCSGTSLGDLFGAEVARPLGMAETRFLPSPGERELIAATELDGDQRLEPGLAWGEVHDGNAFALGGVAGHAGLFAPADDLARFARHILSPSAPVLTGQEVELMATPQAESGGELRGIGWRLRPAGWGDWSERTIWHTGFTGTSMLVDLERGLGVVLLTNGVHPRRRLEDQAGMRAQLHRLVDEATR